MKESMKINNLGLLFMFSKSPVNISVQSCYLTNSVIVIKRDYCWQYLYGKKNSWVHLLRFYYYPVVKIYIYT